MRIISPHAPLIEELSNNLDNRRYSFFGRTKDDEKILYTPEKTV
jgi:hypothetical protein